MQDEPNGTPETESAETLHDQISAAYEELAGTKEPQEQQVEQAPAIEAPAHWPEPDRQRFAQAAPDWQQWLLERHKSTEADYTRKTQELASQRKQVEQSEQYAQQVRQLYEPLRQYGWDERTTAQWAHALATNPQATLAELQKLYGQGSQQAQPQSEFVDPVTQQLQQQLNGLTQWQQQQQQNQQRYFQMLQEAAQTQEIDTYWQQWSSQKDEKGSPRFPHFGNDEVRQTMGALLSSFPDRYTEDQAYALAVQAHIKPESVIPQRNVADAKRAGFSVQGGPPAQRTIRSTRDAIEAAWDSLSHT